MRLALTLYDDNNAALEITSVQGDTFGETCHLMQLELSWGLRPRHPDEVQSTAVVGDGPSEQIRAAVFNLGGLEDIPPTVSC